jgi:hypothetical protein
MTARKQALTIQPVSYSGFQGPHQLSEVFTDIEGKPQSFECKVDGAKWYHNGALSSRLTIEEVWGWMERK